MALEKKLGITRRNLLKAGLAGIAGAALSKASRRAYAGEISLDKADEVIKDLPSYGKSYKPNDFTSFTNSYSSYGIMWETLPESARKTTENKWDKYPEAFQKYLCNVYGNTEEFAKDSLSTEDSELFMEFKEAYKSLVKKERLSRFKARQDKQNKPNKNSVQLFKPGLSIEKIKKEYSEYYPWLDFDEIRNDGDFLIMFIQEKGRNRIDYREIIERNKRTPMPKIRIID